MISFIFIWIAIQPSGKTIWMWILNLYLNIVPVGNMDAFFVQANILWQPYNITIEYTQSDFREKSCICLNTKRFLSNSCIFRFDSFVWTIVNWNEIHEYCTIVYSVLDVQCFGGFIFCPLLSAVYVSQCLSNQSCVSVAFKCWSQTLFIWILNINRFSLTLLLFLLLSL